MPNHLFNRIRITAKEERRKEILEAVKTDKYGVGTIDFNKVIPMPDNIYKGDMGDTERALYGKDNWYDWSVEHWGTKWDAYGYDVLDIPDDGTIVFTTAWSPVPKVVAALSEKYPDARFEYEWADEDIGCNVGRVKYKIGVATHTNIPQNQSREALEMYAEITGVELSDHGYIFDEETGEYLWADDDSPAFFDGGIKQ